MTNITLLVVFLSLVGCASNEIGPPISRTDSGTTLDSGSGPDGGDSGSAGFDAGSPGFDAGSPGFDVGPPGFDAGPPPGFDAGPPPGFDAGAPRFDSGPAHPVGAQAARYVAAILSGTMAFCQCDVEAMFYSSVAECLADAPGPGPMQTACAQSALDASPMDAAVFECLAGAIESHAACARAATCADINGAGTAIDRCDATLDGALPTCGMVSGATGSMLAGCGF